MSAATGRLFDVGVHFVTHQVLEAKAFPRTVRPGDVRSQVLSNDDDRPAQFLLGAHAGPHLTMADEIHERMALTANQKRLVGRHTALGHLRNELVLVPLADELLSGLDVDAVLAKDKAQTAQ